MLSFNKLIITLTFILAAASTANADRFSFVALGDTAYNGAPDYAAYNALIDTINSSKPAFSIHIGDFWGARVCSDDNYAEVKTFFDRYKAPVIYTPGDNEWTDCFNSVTGGYEASERLNRLRDIFFARPESLGKKTRPLVRQSDISGYLKFRENVRWYHKGVLFLTLNVSGSGNNIQFDDAAGLSEAGERNAANIAWLRDGFRIARESDIAAVVVSFHAEILMNGQLPLDSYNGPLRGVYGKLVQELRVAGGRFGKPVLLIHGDSHEFIVDRPLIESRGESETAKYANIIRLEVFGAPEIKSVQVNVDTKSPWVFSFSPLYNAE